MYIGGRLPPTTVVFYRDAAGRVPVLDWIRDLGNRNLRAAAQIRERIRLLEIHGHELRRPHAAPLRDGIHELRVRTGRVHYRVLNFFHATGVAVLASGLTKEADVDDAEIDRAVERKRRIGFHSMDHTYRGA